VTGPTASTTFAPTVLAAVAAQQLIAGGDVAVTAVTVGNILFRSNHNATVNPAVDTVAVGGTVTWTWVNTNTTPHSVMSTGSPSFTSSALLTGNGQSYNFTFGTAGTYQYTCAEHPGQMTGRIVVR